MTTPDLFTPDTETLAATDIAASKKTTSISSLLAAGEYPSWEVDFIFHSFYLPVDVLRNSKYKISPVQVLQQGAFPIYLETCKTNKELLSYEGCNLSMLYAAKAVGVSRRKILFSGQVINIFKLWYGRIPS